MPEPRRPYVAGNWKMHKTVSEARPYVETLLPLLPDPARVQVGICVPYLALAAAVEAAAGSALQVAAQNMHQEPSGAFTGEVSAAMLTEVGAQAVVLGHSERRRHNAESDRALQEKVPAAIAAGLQPILCVGETEEEHEADETQRRLRHQVQEGLEKVPDDGLGELIVAYEPVWAIGTGKVATAEQAQDAIGFIRALVGDRSRAAAERLRVIYGGSVTPDNAAEIMAQPDVDGALVGGASLAPDALAAIAGLAAAA